MAEADKAEGEQTEQESPEMEEEKISAKSSESDSISSGEPVYHKPRVKKYRKVPKRGPKFMDIPGLVKIPMSPLTQKIVGCIVGEHVTGEKPWIHVQKQNVQDNIDLHEESSDFLPIKDKLEKYTPDTILIGYVPSESAKVDKFYICLTEKARDRVLEIIQQQKEAQELRLYNTIYRTVKEWISKTSEATEKELELVLAKDNRPHLLVLLEAAYPIMYDRVEFRCRTTEDVYDGYVEIISTRQTFNNVVKKRIDGTAQAAPYYSIHEIQTIHTYPKNVWTQYEYDARPTKDQLERFHESKRVKAYFSDPELVETFSDLLSVNKHIDLYSNDYQDLVVDPTSTKAKRMKLSKDYTSFFDIESCRGKMINSAMWHPFWTGTIAIAYAELSPYVFIHTPQPDDEVDKVVHGLKPVLLWSFLDHLNPRLRFDTPRNIKRLAFCPYDENLLVGGCSNGQVILWDITNKLQHVEEEEILTPTQKKYRNLMASLMTWMKNIKDISVVKYALMSDLEYSHYCPVTSVIWLPNNVEITKTGQMRVIPPEKNRQSRQFMTAGRDGTVLIWDLLAKPVIQPGSHFRPPRKLKRLEKRPSALNFEVSPFRKLNRIFKPIFRLNLSTPRDPTKLYAITSFFLQTPTIKVKEVNPNAKRRFEDRVIYEIDYIEDFQFKTEFCAGTCEGEFIVGKWEGFSFNAGEVVNYEDTKVLNTGRYHDGPIAALSGCKIKDYVLSVGGSIFCIWKTTFKNRPIFWKKSNCIYINGDWNRFRPAMFKLVRSDGKLEMWNLVSRSDSCIAMQSISGHSLINCRTHLLRLKQNVMGLADTTGTFRLFYLPRSLFLTKGDELGELEKFFDREVERKSLILAWQDEWNEKHAKWVKEKKKLRQQYQPPPQPQQQEEKKEEKGEETKETAAAAEEEGDEEAPKKKKKEEHPPGFYSMWEKERWEKKEGERMHKVLLAKKSLNKDLLERQQLPLKKKAIEEEKKRIKKEQWHKVAPSMFTETVAMLFPEAVKEKPIPPPDPYKLHYESETINECYSNFMNMKKDAGLFIRDNPFESLFDWRTCLEQGRSRRTNLDPLRHEVILHQKRHEMYKEERRLEEERENAPPPPPPPVRLTSSEMFAMGGGGDDDDATDAEAEEIAVEEPQPDV